MVGARSAVLHPLWFRLVVVDEEHEQAYKQEDAPRYHGRDVAVYRAYLNQAVCLLGSTTPSLETARNVGCEKYKKSVLAKELMVVNSHWFTCRYAGKHLSKIHPYSFSTISGST